MLSTRSIPFWFVLMRLCIICIAAFSNTPKRFRKGCMILKSCFDFLKKCSNKIRTVPSYKRELHGS